MKFHPIRRVLFRSEPLNQMALVFIVGRNLRNKICADDSVMNLRVKGRVELSVGMRGGHT